MNVIISNKYQETLSNLKIDVIKSLNGEFEADEIISMFSNFYFNKMIIDITAIKNYKDIVNLQRLSISLDMNKVILLLDDSEESGSPLYLSGLISIGIYNFTKSLDGIMYLYDHANTYRDVAHIHQPNISAITTTQPIPTVNSEYTKDYKTEEVANIVSTPQRRIVGFRNVTDHAGSSSLVYMLKKQLEKNYSVVAIEINKSDFIYFNNQQMISSNINDLQKELNKYANYEVILLDLNSGEAEGFCTDIIYLIEPTTFRLNKLMLRDSKIFEKLKNKKIVLNMSLLDTNAVRDFEYESRSEVFYSIPPVDDKKAGYIPILDIFLTKLGLNRQRAEQKIETNRKNSFFGMFK